MFRYVLLNVLFCCYFILYGKITSWPISYVVKIFMLICSKDIYSKDAYGKITYNHVSLSTNSVTFLSQFWLFYFF